MRPKKDKASITLDSDLIERIKELAENDDRSFSQYINMVLREHAAKINGDKGGKHDMNTRGKRQI